MADSKAKGLVFTPDTNILLNLIFDEYAERDAIDQYNDACSMPSGLERDKKMYQVTQYLYDRPFYMLLRELIRANKVTLDISPIVYSEIINSGKLDEDIAATIQVSMHNMIKDRNTTKTILTPVIIGQAFSYYIDEKFGGAERLNKKLGGYNVAEYLYALRERFIDELLDDSLAKSDDTIFKTRRYLVKIIKQDLIKTKVAKLSGQVRFMSLAEKGSDGNETEFRESVYNLADNYRLNEGDTDKRQSIPQSEINDSLIMAIGSRCNIPVVTNDRKGLIASKKHIHNVNDKLRKKYKVLITGEPLKLEEFIVKYFPEEVIEFSTRYKPIERLDKLEHDNERIQSLMASVKYIRDNPKQVGATFRDGAIDKQYKDVKGSEIRLVESDEFFDSFMKTSDYNRFVGAVQIARDREKDTFETNVLELQDNVNLHIRTLKLMTLGLRENKGKLEPTDTVGESRLAQYAQETYRLLLIYASRLYNDLYNSKSHGKYNDYKKIIESLGVKVIEPTHAEAKKSNTFSIVIDGIRFSEGYTKGATKQLRVGLSKNMSDDMMLVCLENAETRDVMLHKDKNYFGTRYQRMLSPYQKMSGFYSYHSFATITSITPPENDASVQRYRDNIKRLSGDVTLER